MIEKLKTPKSINWDDTPEGLIQRHEIIMGVYEKVNQLVDAVNELQGMRVDVNNHECRLAYLEHEDDIPDGDDAIQEVIHADHYVEQRQWIGKLCRFWDDDAFVSSKDWAFGMLTSIDKGMQYQYCCNEISNFKHCEPVKPDDDIIYKGGDND